MKKVAMVIMTATLKGLAAQAAHTVNTDTCTHSTALTKSANNYNRDGGHEGKFDAGTTFSESMSADVARWFNETMAIFGIRMPVGSSYMFGMFLWIISRKLRRPSTARLVYVRSDRRQRLSPLFLNHSPDTKEVGWNTPAPF